MVLLNGRSKNDSPAYFPFMGKQGFSVIDLVCSLLNRHSRYRYLQDLELSTLSDHLPVLLDLNITFNPIEKSVDGNLEKRLRSTMSM